MIQSMTGFAAKTIVISGENNEKTSVSISIKSLNSRFFDTTFKLHYSLSSLEHLILSLAKDILHRGHIYCTIHVTNPNAFRGAVQPSLATIESYCTAIDAIKEQCHIDQPIHLEHILQLPNIFSMEEAEISNHTIEQILTCAQELLHNVCTMREQEGLSLQKDLENRIEIMNQEINSIAEKSVAVIEKQKAKILKTLQEIHADEALFASAQKNALYGMLDKLDLNEEIVRFKSHIKNLAENLQSSATEKGKRIDFLLQELGREINTISAKCSDASISEHAINIKVEIEKAREQAQNIV
jgi:uncharacterized protein (TIGR00255 family)